MFRLSRWQGRQLLVEDCFSLSAYYFQTNSLRGKLLYLLPLNWKKKKVSRNPWSQYYHPMCASAPILFGMWCKSSFYCLVSFSCIYVISKKREIGLGRDKERRGGEFGNKSWLEQNKAWQYWPWFPNYLWSSSFFSCLLQNFFFLPILTFLAILGFSILVFYIQCDVWCDMLVTLYRKLSSPPSLPSLSQMKRCFFLISASIIYKIIKF